MNQVKYFTVLMTLCVLTAHFAYALKISEGIYEGAAHYIVKTRSATFYFDRSGGGFSRMIDPKGNDWIGFRREPWAKVPESAASAFRGIPNVVFQGDDGGCGHPGFDQCTSVLEDGNIIRTKSKSGKWEWTWTFYEDKAIWKVLKSDETKKYWFLYEGPVGGKFDPQRSFWGNSSGGPEFNQPDHLKGERVVGNWRWVYLGQKDQNNVLLIQWFTPVPVSCSFSYMGNTQQGINSPDGMVVLGFGRTADTKPMLEGENVFILSFINLKHSAKNINTQIVNTIKKNKKCKGLY